jgi:hypothetical protein
VGLLVRSGLVWSTKSFLLPAHHHHHHRLPAYLQYFLLHFLNPPPTKTQFHLRPRKTITHNIIATRRSPSIRHGEYPAINWDSSYSVQSLIPPSYDRCSQPRSRDSSNCTVSIFSLLVILAMDKSLKKSGIGLGCLKSSVTVSKIRNHQCCFLGATPPLVLLSSRLRHTPPHQPLPLTPQQKNPENSSEHHTKLR